MEMAIAVERTIWIEAPRDRVWHAVTDPLQLEQWYAVGCPWEIPALEVGATVRFHNTDTDILSATIEVLDPPRQFTLRWQPDPTYPETALVTTFILEEEKGGTRVTINESGYESLPEDVRGKLADQAGEGYAISMESLKAHLERAGV